MDRLSYVWSKRHRCNNTTAFCNDIAAWVNEISVSYYDIAALGNNRPALCNATTDLCNDIAALCNNAAIFGNDTTVSDNDAAALWSDMCPKGWSRYTLNHNVFTNTFWANLHDLLTYSSTFNMLINVLSVTIVVSKRCWYRRSFNPVLVPMQSIAYPNTNQLTTAFMHTQHAWRYMFKQQLRIIDLFHYSWNF